MASSAAQLIADWQAAAASGDAARLCGLYAPDAVLVDCSGEVHQGDRAHWYAGAHLAEHIPSSGQGRCRRWLEGLAVGEVLSALELPATLGLIERLHRFAWKRHGFAVGRRGPAVR
jgi:hypothetical protein